MKKTNLLLACGFLTLAVSLSPGALADVVMTTGTNDAMVLDFDGSGTETDGDLGFVSKTFLLTGAALPSDPAFAAITSITIEIMAGGGNLSANNSAGTTAGGIGVAAIGESGSEVNLLSVGTSESITINVSSTSTIPSQQVLLSGIRFSSWRGAFPVSQVQFSGATVGGNSFLTGTSGTPIAEFDSAVSSVSFQSVSGLASGGGDSFRMHDLRFSVSNVPEPGTAISGLFLLAANCLLIRGRR